MNTQNILEISYQTLPTPDKVYYALPGEFLSEDEFNHTVMINALDASDEGDTIYSVINHILNQDHVEFELDNPFSDESFMPYSRPYPSKPSSIKNGTVVGISDANMDIFNGNVWVNTSDQCGAYAAAVMITYMDKYYGGNYFIESGSYESGQIIKRLKEKITGASNENQVLNAINSIFLEDYPSGGKHGTVTETLNTIKSKISSHRPVCLLLWKLFDSGYGDHWVCAYQYVTYNNETWFHVHDNWSGNNHRGWILAGWYWRGIYTN